MQDWDDRRMLASIGRGDKAAMRAFYQRYHDGVCRFIQARGADREDAADVVHDAMMEVWRAAKRYRGTASARSWLFAIARNKYVDRVRGSARLSFVEEVPESSDAELDSELILSSSQDAARVRKCLSALKAAQQSVVRMAFFDDLTYTEIGEIEGVPAGTVKSRIFHAKQALLRCLGR